MPQPDTSGPGGGIGDLAFAAAVIALFALLVLEVAPQLLGGALLDTDSYMRLVRVDRLAEAGGWYDGRIPRSNAPFGEELHWTRPVDILLLLGTWLLAPLMGFDRALHLSGVFLSPTLLVATCFAVAWTVTPLAGRHMRYYAMIGVLAQPAIMSYALPGRADHHALILLLFVLMCGAALRTFSEPDDRRSALICGTVAGMGVWASTEFLMALAVLLGAFGGAWIPANGRRVRAFVRVSGALAVTLVAALAIERPPASLLDVEFDRLSIVHVTVALMAISFWAVARWWENRNPSSVTVGDQGSPARRPVARALRVLLGAATGAMALAVLFPGFFAGPMAEVDPELKQVWLSRLTEYQPFLVPHGLADVGRLVAYLGAALLAIPFLVWWLRRDETRVDGASVLFLILGLLVFVPLGIRWVRFAPYAEALGLIVLVVALREVLSAVDARFEGPRRTLGRVLASAGLLVGPLLAGAVLMASGGQAGSGARTLAETQIEACRSDPMLDALAAPDGLGREPRAVLAHVDLGPEILYRTPHSVVSTPYHRNAAGILDGRAILAARDEETSRQMIAERGIDWVLVCGQGSAASFYGGQGDPGTLYGRLVAGRPPPWLVPITLPPESSGGFRLYRVRPE